MSDQRNGAIDVHITEKSWLNLKYVINFTTQKPTKNTILNFCSGF